MDNVEMQKRSRRVKVFWSVAAVVLIAVITFSMLPTPVEADLAKVDRGDVRVEVVDEGRTRMHDVYVISAPITGRVLRVTVEPGDTVKAGDVVARMSRAAAGFLDTRSDLQARATVSAAEAQLRSSEAELALADREHKRNRELLNSNLVSKSVAEQSEARLEAAKAARDASAAEVTRARSALLAADRTEAGTVSVKSPSAGSVLRVPQESEAVIAAGTPIVEVGDTSHVEVIAEFLSQDAVRMKNGARAQIENWGGPALPAVVDRVEPIARTKVSAPGVEEQRTNVILQFAPEAKDKPRAHAFRVDVRVVIDEDKGALRAPLGAFFRRGERWAVYKVVNDKVAVAEVEVGNADGRYRAIKSGLSEGDQVVVFPSNAIVEGASVRARVAAKS